MTREEAIKELSREYFGDSKKITEAKRIAVKALSAEPCEDCISRAEAIKAIRNYNVTIEVSRAIGKSQLADIVDTINKVQEKMISELPSIQPKPKTDVLDKIRAVVIRWQTDTWTDNLSHECMRKIADILPVKIRNESEEKE